MTEEILTHEAKEAIRSYMIKLIALPGVLLTIISFSMGFFVKDWAYQKAYNAAYSEAFSSVIKEVSDLSKEVGGSTKDAKSAVDQANNLVTLIEVAATEVDVIKGKIKTAEAFQKSEEIVLKVSEEIIKRGDIDKLLSDRYDARIKAINESIGNIQNSLPGYIKFNENIEIYNPAAKLNIDIEWPGPAKPQNGTRV